MTASAGSADAFARVDVSAGFAAATPVVGAGILLQEFASGLAARRGGTAHPERAFRLAVRRGWGDH